MENLIAKWRKQAENCRKAGDKTKNSMTQQAWYAEAQVLETCADELQRTVIAGGKDTVELGHHI